MDGALDSTPSRRVSFTASWFKLQVCAGKQVAKVFWYTAGLIGSLFFQLSLVFFFQLLDLRESFFLLLPHFLFMLLLFLLALPLLFLRPLPFLCSVRSMKGRKTKQ